MNNISNKVVNIRDEIAVVENYLKLEKLRYKEALSTSIIIDENVEDDCIIPPLTIQPVVENSIKHGLFRKSFETGEIKISVNYFENKLIIKVSDNGVGLKLNSNFSNDVHSLNLIKRRIEAFEKIYGFESTLNCENIMSNSEIVGLETTLMIDYKKIG